MAVTLPSMKELKSTAQVLAKTNVLMAQGAKATVKKTLGFESDFFDKNPALSLFGAGAALMLVNPLIGAPVLVAGLARMADGPKDEIFTITDPAK